jgi:hypothetical protein
MSRRMAAAVMKPGEVIGRAMLVDRERVIDETTVLLGIGSTTKSVALKLVKPLVPKAGQDVRVAISVNTSVAAKGEG